MSEKKNNLKFEVSQLNQKIVDLQNEVKSLRSEFLASAPAAAVEKVTTTGSNEKEPVEDQTRGRRRRGSKEEES